MNNDMKREDWTKQLKDRLKDYHQQAPDDLWNQIEKSLPQQESASHTARLVSLRRWAVAAVVCLLFGGAMMVWLSKSDSDNGGSRR
jgi:type VI protein secretion system component VasF